MPKVNHFCRGEIKWHIFPSKKYDLRQNIGVHFSIYIYVVDKNVYRFVKFSCHFISWTALHLPLKKTHTKNKRLKNDSSTADSPDKKKANNSEYLINSYHEQTLQKNSEKQAILQEADDDNDDK